MSGTVIALASGGFMSFPFPKVEQIKIEDIARGLSQICRFGGQTRCFYSVAEHSVRVSEFSDRQDALAGLLHDAAEAYIGDLPSPIKVHLPGYQELETRIWKEIAFKFSLLQKLPESVKQADYFMLAVESRDLMPTSAVWRFEQLALGALDPALHPSLSPWTSKVAEIQFLARYADLTACE